MSFRIVPSAHASSSAAAAGADSHSQFKVHDTMRNGMHTVRSTVMPGHPLEAHLENWDLTQQQLKLDMARSVYGLHQPLRIQMEQHLVNKHVKRIPVLKQSNLAQDILTGKDSTIDFEDFLGDSDPSMFLLDVHGAAERTLGMTRGAPL
ncbi:proteasome maturation factor UMP1 [Rhizoclosmatium globosum]|uniref:Proteasome maturation factor UMP1 n=1 Tax=Rhizoclosmatium globosum TaxID=329046 RepID=A0A1Y2CWL5_9FUNG|nr:proteasome maturation factor UMP1 [Rhizoclosmatium globosum]|eukprot:ORY51433.1 proteasome maturation factor UMP1 [Rhizoclosmatium globosum]